MPNDKDIKIDDIDIDVVGEPSTGIDFDDERMVSNSSEICSQEISECLINQQSYRNEFGDDQDFMDKFTDKWVSKI